MKKFKKIFVTVFIILTVTCLSVLPVLAAQVEGGQVGGSSTGSNPNITFYSWTKDQLQIGFTRDNDSSFTLYSPVSNNTITREQGFTTIRSNEPLITRYTDIERFNNIVISTPTFAVTNDTVYHGIGPQFIGQTAKFRMVVDVNFIGYSIDKDAKVTFWPQFTAFFYTNPNNLNDKFEIYERDITYESVYSTGSDFQLVIDYSFEITRSFQVCGFFFGIPMSIFINDEPTTSPLQVNLKFNISDIVLDDGFYEVQGGVENAINSTIGRPGDPNYKEYHSSDINNYESLEEELLVSFENGISASGIRFDTLTELNNKPEFLSTGVGFSNLLENYIFSLDFMSPLLIVSVALGCAGMLVGLAVNIAGAASSASHKSEQKRIREERSHNYAIRNLYYQKKIEYYRSRKK